MAFTRTTTINAAPGGDSTKQAVLDLDTDLTGAFSHLNTLDTTKSATSHNHAGVYEPADGTILKDADIGVNVAAQGHNHDATYAPIAKGVTNGDSHDHVGGDGAAISLTSAVTGVLPIANGGTGSATQNFVDLTTDQTVGGYKSFTNTIATSGNLNFTGTGNRITGDFSNATIANRVMFQNSVVNGATFPCVIPNGTNTSAGMQASNSSDPNNSAAITMQISVNDCVIASTINGTGTLVPMKFRMATTDHLLLSTNGNIVVKTGAAQADDDGVNKLQVTGNSKFTGQISVQNIAGHSDSGAYTIWGGSTTLSGGFVQLYGSSHAINPGMLILGTPAAGHELVLNGTGEVGVGAVPVTGGAKLQVTGDIKSDNYKLSALNTAPASATATGTLGEIRVTATHIYVCTATNTWVRAALSTW